MSFFHHLKLAPTHFCVLSSDAGNATGLVPFGELDAVNAHRNLAAGIALPLQKVSDASMRKLIAVCLQIDADQRISLQHALAKLEEMPKGSAKEEMKDQFAKL
ncbi:hypothetical protein BLNAU_5480 [Blattamonas nauphoetae]|uniref:Uncharacterized protein n=1 Tax=Blattamonas nauphoetae TaxID=2049346 RepID=A0ABQ9Y6R7_9EUKA|nr:hypothetical protein BLNAU_5480 [Blattamonas nauphoetae]